MDDLLGNTGQTAANTGAAADALSTSTEELEYLRDIAERDAINRFTTAEVRIDMTGMTNRIEGGADLDGVISTLTDGFTEALLTAAEDYAALGRALMEALPAQRADTAVLYMGHGSEHQANSAYALMEYAFHDLGRKDVVIGTVEGYPGFGEALRRLKERPQVRRVELRPLMTVAGDHAKNDLAGDEEDSWRRRLEAEGYETACVLTGLGEYPAVRALFVEHARQAEQLQAEAC